ncbi:uncharacterized protein [Coffea arabica]|uniref:ATP-dependent DNA helicase n=1 Tax=Coffea arabica TaxID=13443 RepID=A0A6P6VJT9_COFAR|nr:uncharacterized protein LOC113723972 [Coffea arabica]
MDHNAIKRRRYSNMLEEKKDELLRRRREAYARKKATTVQSTETFRLRISKNNQKPCGSASGLSPSALAPNSLIADSSGCVEQSAISNSELADMFDSMTQHLEASSSALPSPVLSADHHPVPAALAPNSLIADSSGCLERSTISNSELADLFDSMSQRLEASSSTLSSPVLSTDHHPIPEVHNHSLVEEGTCIINVESSCFSKDGCKQQILVNTQLQNTGKRKSARKGSYPRLNNILTESSILPDALNCEHCGAKRFHLEPPSFCCSGGEVSVVIPVMPYELFRLYSGTDEECINFRKNVRTYNNNLAFTSFGAKYDKNLTKNSQGVYTFRVQGQLYFYDQKEEVSKRLGISPRLRESTLKLLMGILDKNPYTRFFKSLRNLPNLDDHNIFLNSNPGLDQRLYNMPTSSEVAAIWTETDNESLDKSAHTQVYTHSNSSHRIQHYFAGYDSLQYPLLFPRDESGWHYGIPRNTIPHKRKRKESDDDALPDVSQIRSVAGLIDMENEVAEEGKNKQETISTREYYCYKLQIRDDDRSMILHTRRLLQQFAVDIYVKIEISRLEYHRKKQTEIRTEILKGAVDSISTGQAEGSKIGRRVYLLSSFIGGPRDMRRRYIDAMSLVQRYEYKPLNLEAYDMIVSAEIPDPVTQRHLYFLVMKHMIHGPCGSLKKDNVCMKDGMCKNHYPKDFNDYTTYVEDGYPHYRRKMNGRSVKVRNHLLDNRWVVPYNPYLLALFDCHLNVEICSTVKLVKYLYKYVYKGHDRVSFHIHSENSHEDVDEILDFQSGGWVVAAEAFWRIFRFKLSEMTPSVYALQVHLPGEQMISFHNKTNLADLVNDVDFSKTMLTEYFYVNRTNKEVQNLKFLYKQFPKFFVWKPAKKRWSRRKQRRVIGRLVSVSPTEGERYYLKLLLTHVRAPTSFDDLLTVNGVHMSSYRSAAFEMGLLQSDTYIEDTLDEVATFQMPSSFRSLFATILTFCSPSNPKGLWEKYESELSRDFQRNRSLTGNNSDCIRMLALEEINKLLEQIGKKVDDFHLVFHHLRTTADQQITKEIEAERNIQFSAEDLLLPSRLNMGQKFAYDTIMKQIFSTEGKSFFIDGSGGTGKTFLYRSILATLRSQGYIAIAVASSGVAASILPGGRTAHSRFKIPLDMSEVRPCQISKQGSTAKLIVQSKLILWDEASMVRRETIEAFDMLLKDIMECSDPFGGKVVIFGGDFRQTLPVIQNATRDVLVQASFVNSPLWSTLQKITLTENMRAVMDPPFSEFLLQIGEGRQPEDEDGKISLCKDMVIHYDGKDTALTRLIQTVFSDLNVYSLDPYQMINHCILSATNSAVDDVNQTIIDRFPGEAHVYTSTDRTLNEKDQGNYEDLLNSLNPKGLPPHKLILKKNCPLILVRNLNPTEGLCNGTRLICKELRQNTICAEIAVGQHRGKQGQTLDYVGIYLREPVFSHGQLYVALSEAKTSAAVKVLIMPATFHEVVTEFRTRNIVFHEVLELSKQMVNLLCIDDVKPRMKGWSAHVTVEEKIHVAISKHSSTRYQKVVLADSKGSRVEGIMFNSAVEKMGPKFHVFKKYLISNADVREIEEKYQTNGLTIQWVISTRTVVEELDEQGCDVLPSQYCKL